MHRPEEHPAPHAVFAGGLIRFESDAAATVPPHAPCPPSEKSDIAILCGAEEDGLSLFRSCVVELLATTLQQVLHIGIVRTAASMAAVVPPPITGGVCHCIMLTLLIFTAAAPSGGHMNPTISWATAFTGHTTILRAACYTAVQLIGSILGTVLMRVIVGWDRATMADLAGCSHGSMTHGQAFVAEAVFTLCLIFFAFGIAFEPKQGQIFGPVLAPFLIGAALGVVIFAGSALVPSPAGGAGIPSMNWTVCFGPSVVMGSFEATHWVYPVATVLVAILHGPLFVAVPPHHKEHGMFTPVLLREKRSRKHRDE